MKEFENTEVVWLSRSMIRGIIKMTRSDMTHYRYSDSFIAAVLQLFENIIKYRQSGIGIAVEDAIHEVKSAAQ